MAGPVSVGAAAAGRRGAARVRPPRSPQNAPARVAGGIPRVPAVLNVSGGPDRAACPVDHWTNNRTTLTLSLFFISEDAVVGKYPPRDCATVSKGRQAPMREGRYHSLFTPLGLGRAGVRGAH